MKKRLLSAALALAMALTLLPATVVPASAAAVDGATESSPVSGKSTVQYISGTNNDKLDKSNQPLKAPGGAWAWQYKDGSNTYWTQSSSLKGIVNGTNANGVWYDSSHKTDANGNQVLNSTSFTLVGDETVPVNLAATLSINLCGKGLTFSGSFNKLNSLTITDTVGGGSVAEIKREVQEYNTVSDRDTKSASGLTLNITGAKVASISLKGRANRVTLTGATVEGAITMDGTTKVTNGTTTTPSYDAQTLTTAGAAAYPYTPCKLGKAVSITGNRSSVILKDAEIEEAVTVASTGSGSQGVYVDGASSIKSITVNCGTDAKETEAPISVTVNGGTVGSITRGEDKHSKTAGSITVNQNGHVSGKITTANGVVAIHSAKVDGEVSVGQGSLTIDGNNAQVGDLVLAAEGKTTFNFSGAGHKVGNVSATNGANLTIGANWPTGRSNTFGTLSFGAIKAGDKGTPYKGQGIKGGIFGTAADSVEKALWFSPDLQFMRKDGVSYAYYGKRELSDAIADAGASAKDQGTINVIGDSEDMKYANFFNSVLDIGDRSKAIATLGYGATTAIYLPDKINGTPVATWTNAKEAKTYSVNEQVSLNILNKGNIDLVLQSSGAAVSKLTNVTVEKDFTNSNDANVTVTLSGNQINLSGAVDQLSFANIMVRFTTDLIGNNGEPVTFRVPVAYDTTNKTATFSGLGLAEIPNGVTVNNTSIVVGGNTYSLVTSGLAKPASELLVAGMSGTNGTTGGKEIVVTVNGSMTNAAKKQLIDQIAKAGNEGFDWTTSPAMRQAVNAAIATITNNNQVDNWAAAAQRAAWTLKDKGAPNPTNLEDTGFNRVVLVPYLAMTVTNQNGIMSATMVPSYRVEVRNIDSTSSYYKAFAGKTNGTPEGNYLAQAGRPLSNLISDLTGGGTEEGVVLTFGESVNSAYATQDDTYLYQITDKGTKMKITHSGRSGLGTIVFGNSDPKIHLALKAKEPNGITDKYYNNLQAAVDEAKNDDTLTVYSSYTGSGVINVTGTARKFTIVTMGNTTITPANNNFTVEVDATGHQYAVQLQKNVTPVGGNITITDVANGTASVNVNPANAGQTVTITLRPNTGYVSNGVTVRTNSTNTTVAVTGSGNSYTFTMPAESVTVTPAFRQQTAATATVSVSNSTGMGSTTTTAAGNNNQAAPGSVVGVYTTPASGYRTMGVNVTTNGGAASAVRQGDNYFTFTVPSNATAVTVTPVYDRDNGTKFDDVWSTEYYSNPVAWAVSSGVTDGTGAYTFSPGNYCTRAQMVTFLWRAAGRPSVASISNPFTDVSPTLTPGDYYSAILWAVSKGITQGKTKTTFAPNEYITRAQAVTFLYRFENQPAAGTSSQFYDVSSREYYAKAVSWAANRSVPITTGTTNTTFAPNQYVTRAQAVTFLYRDRTNKLA